MKDLDFVAIGELAIDAFIKLKEAEVICDEKGESCKLCLDYATKIPYESVEEVPAVANAGNAAVCASRLGLSSAIVAHVGKDLNGQKCIESLKKDAVSTDYIFVDEGRETNYHYVLWFPPDRTILQKHSDFDYALPANLIESRGPKWIYLTSLGEKSLDFHKDFHETISDYLKNHPNIKLAFQPGIFQIKAGVKHLKSTYERTDIFFCNVEESQTILGEKSRDLPTLLKGIASLGPKTVVITDGFDGAYIYDAKNKDSQILFMPIYPHTPIERTGAGDAYASTIVSSIAMGKNLEEALWWAGVNSMSVTQFVGAQKGLLNQEKIKEYLKKAPENYKPKNLL
ncbi:MAG TPA: carbohydrate kinase family protein [Candidatus Paceibacterota bacterium]